MNFTATDILLSTAAFLLLGLFLVPPGYALGWLLDLLNFRRQPALTRLLLSLPFSIALTPIPLYLLGRVSLGWPVWTFYALLAAVFLFVFRPCRIPRLAWIALACCFTIGVFSLVDLQLGHRLYYSVAAYDYSFRAAITGAFVRAQHLPAANPFFFDGTPRPFRYHYFWFLLAAQPIRLAEAVFGHTALAPRYAVVASAVWSGLGLLSIASLCLRLLLQPAEALRRRAAWLVLALFAVSGLDILPVMAEQLSSLPEHPWSVYATVDWWNSDQVAGWLDTMLWVPHSAAALIACLTGFLILWNPSRFRWQTALAASLAFASAAGLSVYVTAVFAVFCALWIVYLLVRRQRMETAHLVCAGLCALILAWPFLRELGGNGQAAFAAFTIRKFDPLEPLGLQNSWAMNLLSLPLNYFLELGIFLWAGAAWVVTLRRRNLPWQPGEVALVLMAATPLVFCSFIRSATINMNDLGLRGMLVAQFALLLITALWLAGVSQPSRVAKALIAIGLMTSLYEFGLLRTFTILSDTGFLDRSNAIAADPGIGARGYSARQIYESLDRALPPNAVLQHNPSNHHDIPAGLYANRQFAIRDLPTAITFTGDSAGPTAAFNPVSELFDGDRNDAARVCRDHSIDVLIVKDNDDAWADKTSWAWTMPTLFTAPQARAIACR